MIKLYQEVESFNLLIFDINCLKIWYIIIIRMARENMIHQVILIQGLHYFPINYFKQILIAFQKGFY